MKKNKKIITAALGSAALAGGITVAAVAQACGGDNGRNEAQDITSIVNSINELSNYNPTSGDPSNVLSPLADGILNSFETILIPNSAPQSATLQLQNLVGFEQQTVLLQQIAITTPIHYKTLL